MQQIREKKPKLDYFLLMFPKEIDEFIQWTNANLGDNPLTKHEFVKFLGIMIAMCLTSSRERRGCWKTDDSGLFPPLMFGKRFGMSRTRYEQIINNLELSPPGGDADDKWRPVRFFMDAINNRRVQIFIPGDVICIDESTSKWCGLGDWYDVGLPHITKCSCKPWNLGMEFKDAMCAKSGIMLQMEIC